MQMATWKLLPPVEPIVQITLTLSELIEVTAALARDCQGSELHESLVRAYFAARHPYDGGHCG